MATAEPAAAPDARMGGVWCAVFLVAAVLFIATANRGAQWQDSGWQQLRIVRGELIHRGGLVLSHPLQYHLGRAAIRLRCLEPAFAITLLSCVAAAVAVANLVCAVRALTQQTAAALVAGVTLALSHTFWQQATHTESYAIVVALLTGEWLCLARYTVTGRGRWLIGMAFLNGLGVANHLLATLVTPVDLVLLLVAVRTGRLSKRGALAATSLWLLGSLPYTGLVISTLVSTGDWAGTLRSASVGHFAAQVLNTHLTARTLFLCLGYMVYNFPGLTLPLGLCALFSAPAVSRPMSRVLRWQGLLYSLFVIRYSIVDQYTFFTPLYALLALASGIGLAQVLTHLAAHQRTAGRLVLVTAAMTAVWTPAVYTLTPRILASKGALASMVGNKPYRDGYRAMFIPWGVGESYAVRVNVEASRLAGDAGLILSDDGMIQVALEYSQVTGGIAPGVRIVDLHNPPTDLVEAGSTPFRALLNTYRSQERPVVLVPRNRDHPPAIDPAAYWERCGDLYRLAGP